MFSSRFDYLYDVDSSGFFYTIDKKVLKNLSDLYEYLLSCDYQSFSHHVNSSKNDFSTWIFDVYKDKSLSDEIKGIFDKNQIKDILESKLNNASCFLKIEQDLIKKLRELLTVIEIKEKEHEEVKHSDKKEYFDLEHLTKLKGIKKILEEISDKLLNIKTTNEEEISNVYVEVSKDLVDITKMLSFIDQKNKRKEIPSINEEHMTKSENLLLSIINHLDKILNTNKELYDKNYKRLESQIILTKKDFDDWKMGDVADHQEIKSTFLAFEKNIDYKISSINDFLKKINEFYYFDEKIKRHTTLINKIDKELSDMKKEIKDNEILLQKKTSEIKELNEKLKIVSKSSKK